MWSIFVKFPMMSFIIKELLEVLFRYQSFNIQLSLRLNESCISKD